ncbi:uncharacterized protein [Palaemon carinicauda]|uniref:uncharacterized protein n=1 Tax=Palaemon carinicauda TaxID=392227 RepID=UPI0035B5B51C
MRFAVKRNESYPAKVTSSKITTDDDLLLPKGTPPPTERDLLEREVAPDMKVTGGISQGGGDLTSDPAMNDERKFGDVPRGRCYIGRSLVSIDDGVLFSEELVVDGREKNQCNSARVGVRREDVRVDYRCEYFQDMVRKSVVGDYNWMTSSASDVLISDEFGALDSGANLEEEISGGSDSKVGDCAIENKEAVKGNTSNKGEGKRRRINVTNENQPSTTEKHDKMNAASTLMENKNKNSCERNGGGVAKAANSGELTPSETPPKRRAPRDRGKSTKHYGNSGKSAKCRESIWMKARLLILSSIWILRMLSDKMLVMTVLVNVLTSAFSSTAIVRAESTKANEKGIGPVFLEPVPNVTVAKGRDASLTCTVDHLGMHKVAWIHLDRQMILSIHNHIITRTPRFSVTHDSHKTWTLQVTAVEERDRGHYMCQVNSKPMISQTGFLQVVVPPNIVDAQSSPSSIVVREKDMVTLSCYAEGFPVPQIKWKREDGQHIKTHDGREVNHLDGPTLPLRQVSRMDMGAYLCIASNGVPPSISKRITLDVEFSPQMHVPNQLVGAPLSTEVHLECFVEAHPRAITYWEFSGSMVMNTSRISTDTIENLYRIHMILIIKDLQESDFGTYKCISKNSIAETDGSITLNKTFRPTSPPQTMLHSSDDEGKSHLTRGRGGKDKQRTQLEDPRRRFQEELDRRQDEEARKRLHDTDRQKYELDPNSVYRDDLSNRINNPPIDSSANGHQAIFAAIFWLSFFTIIAFIFVLF